MSQFTPETMKTNVLCRAIINEIHMCQLISTTDFYLIGSQLAKLENNIRLMLLP